MSKYITILLTFFVSFQSCKPRVKYPAILMTSYNYQIWLSNIDRIDQRDSSILFLDSTIVESGKKIYLERYLNDSIKINNSYSINKTGIEYYGQACTTLDSIFITKDSILLIRSYYDRENSQDEESEIFWNPKLGIVGVYNSGAWGSLNLIERQNDSSGIKDCLYHYLIHRHKKKDKAMIGKIK